mmetsp:Transcript_6799/g.17527  ORF Transcript_6799/g.17527 Transcript_6799/m.17527 type:complete len:415 (-) Transcript_6799:9-1253(-)
MKARVPRARVLRSNVVQSLQCDLLALLDDVRAVAKFALGHGHNIPLLVADDTFAGAITWVGCADWFVRCRCTVIQSDIISGNVDVSPHLEKSSVVRECRCDRSLVNAVCVGGNVVLNVARWMRYIENVVCRLLDVFLVLREIRHLVPKVVLLWSVRRSARLDGGAEGVVRAAREAALEFAPPVGTVALDASLQPKVLVGVNVYGSQHVDIGSPRVALRVGKPAVVVAFVSREVVRGGARLGANTKDVLEVAAAHTVVRFLLVEEDPVMQVDLGKWHRVLVAVHNVRLDGCHCNVSLGHGHLGAVWVSENNLPRGKLSDVTVEGGGLRPVWVFHAWCVLMLCKFDLVRVRVDQLPRQLSLRPRQMVVRRVEEVDVDSVVRVITVRACNVYPASHRRARCARAQHRRRRCRHGSCL